MHKINLKRPEVPPHGTIIVLDGIQVRARDMNIFNPQFAPRIVWDVLKEGTVVASFYSRPGEEDARRAVTTYVTPARQETAEKKAHKKRLEKARQNGAKHMEMKNAKNLHAKTSLG